MALTCRLPLTRPVQVINFYLGLLQDREVARAGGGQPRVHFHNTFFYNKLYKGTGSYDFKAVSRRVAPFGVRVRSLAHPIALAGRARSGWATRLWTAR